MKQMPALILSLFVIAACSVTKQDTIQTLSNYDVIWSSPSKDYTGTMPLGNGDIGINAWMEESGDLLFYISKTDAWGDNSRLLKVGKVRVTMTPKPGFDTLSFTQRLNLAQGQVEFFIGSGADQVTLTIRVDANNPLILINTESSESLQLTAHIESWRTKPYELPAFEVSDIMLDRSKPDQKHEPMIVEPDVILSKQSNQIGWYHHNSKSIGPEITMDIQGLSGYSMEDPILHRTFGAIIRSADGKPKDDLCLQTTSANKHELQITVLTLHPSSPEEWLQAINREADKIEAIPKEKLDQLHINWWNDFWNRSWIYASNINNENGEDDAFIVTQGYVLQRFINACAGRGAYPIKFNGSIFTVPYPGTPGDADYRRWGPGYWWQNTRLPYLSMCTSGDYDMLKPLFNMYAGDVFKLSKYRTKTYFGHDGVYFPECIYFWGTVFSESYGWTPASEREDKLQVSGYHKWEWVCGPELVWMMLDYYDHLSDNMFLQDTIIPVAFEVMHFFDNYYTTNEKGKLIMYPSQAVETWWDCTNPMPELAGLTAISNRLLNLPKDLIEPGLRKWLEAFIQKLPDLPLRLINDKFALAPADRYEQKRNIENPELYAVFPFRLVSLEKDNVDWGLNAFEHRWDKGNFGWRQEEIFMAYLGLAEQARTNLVGRAKNHDKNSRFPAFWGPNYDWVPDQDHGGILLKAFQSMLLQTDGEKIYLIPAWPADWNADFKLHAPQQTIITGTIREGKIIKLKVVPSKRRKDIVILGKKDYGTTNSSTTGIVY